MSPKFYAWLWIVFLAAFAMVGLMGSLTMFALVVFGFIAFGMIFTGMMCVLPAAVGPHAAANTAAEHGRSLRSVTSRIKGVSSRWPATTGVEMRQPRFH